MNLSKNCIKKIENLSHLSKLSTLIISHNGIRTAEDVAHLALMPGLHTIDLQSNKLDDAAIVDEVLAQLPELRVLYLQGNPVVKKIPHYRKTVISKCVNLRYLDDRPVFEEERRRVTAWASALATNGIDAANEAEREEIKNIRLEKDEADERNFRAFGEMMREGVLLKRQKELELSRLGVDMEPATNVFSGEAIIPVPESAKLKEIRESRWRSESSTSTNNNNDDDDSLKSKQIWSEIPVLEIGIVEEPVNTDDINIDFDFASRIDEVAPEATPVEINSTNLLELD